MTKGRLLILPADARPMTLGHYTLTSKGLTVDESKGRPSWEEHAEVGAWIDRAYQAAGWWLGDWLRYGESRQDWQQQLEAAEGATGLSLKRLKNLRSLAAIDPSRRRVDLTVDEHDPVVALEPADQTRWLDKAVTEGWNRHELRQAIRASHRRAVVEGQARLKGQSRVLSADCPWKYQNAQPSGSSSEAHFPPMTIEELCDLPVRKHVTKNAVMGFWVPAPMLYDSPGPIDVVRAWGFDYKNFIAWDKVDGAGGWYTKGTVELFLICTRGSGTPDVAEGLPETVYRERKDPVHSKKPAFFRRYLEKHWTYGPYLELFGREPVEGWQVFGNDPKLWDAGGDDGGDEATAAGG
jgi:N6-adenosine-specific RNA methylase IME4